MKEKRCCYIIFAFIVLILFNKNAFAEVKTYTNSNIVNQATTKNVEIAQSCSSLLGNPKKDGDPADYLTFAFKVVRYVAIVLLLVLSTMDFVGAVAASDDDALKKAFNHLMIRLVLCVVIFLLPVLIEFILQIINNHAIDLCIDA